MQKVSVNYVCYLKIRLNKERNEELYSRDRNKKIRRISAGYSADYYQQVAVKEENKKQSISFYLFE
jgi:hypothetical protein